MKNTKESFGKSKSMRFCRMQTKYLISLPLDQFRVFTQTTIIHNSFVTFQKFSIFYALISQRMYVYYICACFFRFLFFLCEMKYMKRRFCTRHDLAETRIDLVYREIKSNKCSIKWYQFVRNDDLMLIISMVGS